jgi:hypothetical protein
MGDIDDRGSGCSVSLNKLNPLPIGVQALPHRLDFLAFVQRIVSLLSAVRSLLPSLNKYSV